MFNIAYFSTFVQQVSKKIPSTVFVKVLPRFCACVGGASISIMLSLSLYVSWKCLVTSSLLLFCAISSLLLFPAYSILCVATTKGELVEYSTHIGDGMCICFGIDEDPFCDFSESLCQISRLGVP